MVRKCIAIWICIWLSSGSIAQEVFLSADKDALKIGEQVELTLELNGVNPNDLATWPQVEDSLSGGWEIIQQSGIDSVETSLFQRYLVTRWDSGYAVVPPFEIKLNETTLESNPLLLYVAWPDSVSQVELRDIKDIREVNYGIFDWMKDNAMWLISIVLLLLAAFLLYRWQKNRPVKEKPAPKEKEVPLEPAHIIAFERLNQLEQKTLWQKGFVKEYYSELSDITRTYLEHRYRVPALERTSREIIYDLRTTGMTQEQLQKVRALLEIADMAKFAKYKPVETENISALRNVRTFVEETAEVVQTQ